MTPEVELIRALAEDLALEILASYTPDDFRDADFSSLGKAAVYLADRNEELGPSLEELIKRVQKAAGT
jgi:hypothetical protein